MIFTEHPVVIRAEKVSALALKEKKRLESDRRISSDRFDDLTANWDYLRKEIRQMIKLLKNDSEKLLTIEFEGSEEWLDFTMTDAVLLKIKELSDRLYRKVSRASHIASP